MLTTREVAKDRSEASKYLGNVIIIRLLLGFAVVVSMDVLVNVLGYSQQTAYVVYIISVATILTVF
jgi:hypothetical protein